MPGAQSKRPLSPGASLCQPRAGTDFSLELTDDYRVLDRELEFPAREVGVKRSPGRKTADHDLVLALRQRAQHRGHGHVLGRSVGQWRIRYEPHEVIRPKRGGLTIYRNVRVDDAQFALVLPVEQQRVAIRRVREVAEHRQRVVVEYDRHVLHRARTYFKRVGVARARVEHLERQRGRRARAVGHVECGCLLGECQQRVALRLCQARQDVAACQRRVH